MRANEFINEASGYIPSYKQRKDPRFKTALTVDVKPDSIKKNAKAFNWKTSREGIPPQARADGRITESIDFKAFVQYKENQFATEHDELMHILNLKDIDVILKHNLLEALGRKFRPLSEDTEIDVTDDDLKMLHRNYSADNVSVGNRYIPVEVGRYHGSMILYDVYKNSPPKHAAVFATVTSISENAVHMLLDDTTYRYPLPHYGVVSASVTLFIDSAEKYNNLRTLMQLKFGQTLPLLAEDIIAESLMNEWNSFLSEDDQQGELFPGYDKEHKEKRLDNWLQNTHAWDGHKPRVFYHATTKDFDTFNTHGTGFASALGMAFEVERHGSFFAVDPKFAEEFIEDQNRPGQYKEGGRVIPVYLSIQNPIDLRDNNLSYMLRDDETVEGFKANDIDLWSIYRHFDEFMRWELFDGPEGGDFVENLQKLGFDGAIITERPTGDAQSGEVWVVFNPNQVKAIHNRGSFSPDDPSLMRESITESRSEDLFNKYGGRMIEFDQLPSSAKKSLKYYMTVEGERPNFADELMFGYVNIPMDALIQAVMSAPGNDFDEYEGDFGAYHADYWREEDSDYASHLKEMWPVILDDDEGIHDGWHRLHWYYRNGVKMVPAILLVEKD